MAAGQWSPQQHFGIGFVESSVVGSPENRTRPALERIIFPNNYFGSALLVKQFGALARLIAHLFWFSIVIYGGSRLIQREAFGLVSRDVKQGQHSCLYCLLIDVS